jgi:hypothetical protein
MDGKLFALLEASGKSRKPMKDIDKETEALIKRIERAARAAKLQRLSQEECRKRYYQLYPPVREREVEIER